MQLIRSDENIKLKNTIITLGKFDGNHIGHRSLFDMAKKIKSESSTPLSTVVFTFDKNPKTLMGSEETESLYTSAERLRLEETEGLDFVYIWPFTKESMAMEPEDFVREVLWEDLGVKHIVVGEDFRFGKDRKGDVSLLKSLEGKFSFQVHALSKVTYKGSPVSSTRIKEEILKGNLEDANYMLGSPFSIEGKVVSGNHVGKGLGFPTINFDVPEGKIIPPAGVYATRTYIGNSSYIGMTNIGTRPTFKDGRGKTIETNIFDFDRDVYGKKARVEFYKYIRPERAFSDPEELEKELEKNRQEIKAYFKEKN